MEVQYLHVAPMFSYGIHEKTNHVILWKCVPKTFLIRNYAGFVMCVSPYANRSLQTSSGKLKEQINVHLYGQKRLEKRIILITVCFIV